MTHIWSPSYWPVAPVGSWVKAKAACNMVWTFHHSGLRLDRGFRSCMLGRGFGIKLMEYSPASPVQVYFPDRRKHAHTHTLIVTSQQVWRVTGKGKTQTSAFKNVPNFFGRCYVRAKSSIIEDHARKCCTHTLLSLSSCVSLYLLHSERSHLFPHHLPLMQQDVVRSDVTRSGWMARETRGR